MITIPDVLWDEMLDRFAEHPAGLERVAYLDGVRYTSTDGAEHGVATTLVIPRATLRPRNYEISADAMAEAGKHLHPNGLKRLLQVHTHGNDWIDHSDTDDDLAFTRREGAISIVLPFHARRRPTPLDGGVHRRGTDGWTRMHGADATGLVRLVGSVRDLRPQVQPSRRSVWRFWPWNR